jgi:hypothetical protein
MDKIAEEYERTLVKEKMRKYRHDLAQHKPIAPKVEPVESKGDAAEVFVGEKERERRQTRKAQAQALVNANLAEKHKRLERKAAQRQEADREGLKILAGRQAKQDTRFEADRDKRLQQVSDLQHAYDQAHKAKQEQAQERELEHKQAGATPVLKFVSKSEQERVRVWLALTRLIVPR